MAIKITLDGVSITGNSKLLTNSSIKSSDGEVDIKLKDTTLSDGVSVLDSTQLEETQNRHTDAKETESSGSKIAKGIGSFARDVFVNLVSDAFNGKP